MDSKTCQIFDAEKLNAGDTRQTEKWLFSTGMTIFIDWVPDQMTEENAHELFKEYGKVAGIRFQKKDKKRSAFVDYEYWYRNPENEISKDIEAIAKAFPGYHSIDFTTFVDKKGKVPRTFILKCRVDRTIPKESVTIQRQYNKRPNVVPHIMQRKMKTVPKCVKPSMEERILVLEEQNRGLIYEIEVLNTLVKSELANSKTK